MKTTYYQLNYLIARTNLYIETMFTKVNYLIQILVQNYISYHFIDVVFTQ